MSFQPFTHTRTCLHRTGGNYSILAVTPSIKEVPLIRWPSLTRWDMVEEWYAPLTLEGDRILVHRETIAKKKEGKQEEESIWVDYVSEKVHCPQAPEDSPCWMRYAFVYDPTEQRQKLYQINGTSISF